MNKFSTFLFGIALGATLMYVGLKYYVVRATDGYHMVSKSKAEFVKDFAITSVTL